MLHNNVGHELVGTDNDFVAWLFSLGGVLGFSKACLENGRVRILSGPIKTLEEHIIKLDKRNRNALVALNFGGQASRVWLGYELVNEGIAP